MPPGFGTSGVRGKATELTDRVCFDYARAFASYLREIGFDGTVCLGGDLRESTPRIRRAVKAGLWAQGFDVDAQGVLPTPALAAWAMTHDSAAVMVTGSHVPAERNGIKFYRPTGEILKTDEADISARYAVLAQDDEPRFDADGQFRQDPPEEGALSPDAGRAWVRQCMDAFDPAALAGLRIVFHEHASAARDLLPMLLEALGAEVISVDRAAHFVAVDTEAVEGQERYRAWIAEHRADALVSTDGDADRPLVFDDSGRQLPGDLLGLIAARALGAKRVVCPINCNSAIDLCGSFDLVERTRIGSPYVIEGMQTIDGEGVLVGFEANGGFLTEALPTRDSALPICALLSEVAARGESISALRRGLPSRHTSARLRRGVPQEIGGRILELLRERGDELETIFPADAPPIIDVDHTDGARIRFLDDGVVHLRPSGNAPEFRVYSEGPSPEQAEALCDRGVFALDRLLERFTQQVLG